MRLQSICLVKYSLLLLIMFFGRYQCFKQPKTHQNLRLLSSPIPLIPSRIYLFPSGSQT